MMFGFRFVRPRNKVVINLLSVLGGLSLPLLIPGGQMLVSHTLWGTSKKAVDKQYCTCDCWDAVCKGPYESGSHNSYKHIYYNTTLNTFKMWVITLLFFISLYEVFKHLTLLWLKQRVRWPMALLLLTSIHSHYYAFWGTWNYWNDEFYSQWNHQLFFTLTEGISTICVLINIDKGRDLKPTPLILIGTIALFHVGCGMKDQFFRNIVLFEGRIHQVFRDLFLMSTDVLQLIMVFKELKGYSTNQGVRPGFFLREKKFLVLIGGSLTLMFLYIMIFP